MELFIGIVTGLLILVFLVVVHELGHAIVARRNGVVVREFGIGFPPRAWAKKLKNGIVFSLNWLPLGGFVKLKGEYDSSNKPGDYGAASYWKKTKILLAGVAINWLMAALLLTILAWTGLPKILQNQFTISGDTTIVPSTVQLTAVAPDFPAAKAGLQPGDKIITIDGQAPASAQRLVSDIAAKEGQTIKVVYERSGQERTTNVALRDNNDDKKGYLGAGFGQQELIRATWSAPIVGVVTTGQFTWETLKGLGGLIAHLVTGLFNQINPNSAVREAGRANIETAGQGVGGTVAIIGVLFPQAQEAGLTQLTFLAAIISLTLAVMNALPIPALDGGRWYLMTYYRLRKKTLTKEREERFQQIGFGIILILVIVATINDLTRYVF